MGTKFSKLFQNNNKNAGVFPAFPCTSYYYTMIDSLIFFLVIFFFFGITFIIVRFFGFGVGKGMLNLSCMPKEKGKDSKDTENDSCNKSK